MSNELHFHTFPLSFVHKVERNTVIFTNSDRSLHISIRQSLWELIGQIDSKLPLVIDHRGGFIIAKLEKIEYSSDTLRLHVEILPQYGDLESNIPGGIIMLDKT